MNILVLCDDVWHPGEVVELGLRGLQDQVFHFDFIRDAKDSLTEERIARYPVIMNCKADNLTSGNQAPWFEDGVTEVGPREFAAYVRNGGGFLSVHSGNTSNQKKGKAYADFIGNNFVTHPPRCTVEVSVVEEHPVTRGVKDFSVRDEHYQLEGIAKDARILLKSTSRTGGTQVAGYVREMGKGRICALTPGHILSVWENEMFQKLLINAINWCAGKGKES